MIDYEGDDDISFTLIRSYGRITLQPISFIFFLGNQSVQLNVK